MPRIIKKIHFIIYLFTFFLVYRAESSKLSAECEKSWANFQPVMNDLKSAIACGSQYTFKECRENLALEGAIGAGAIAGVKAARKITLQTPTTCKIGSLKNPYPYQYILPLAHAAACGSPLDNLKYRILEDVETNTEIHRREIANNLLEKLRKADPELDKLAEEAFNKNIRNRTGAGSTSKTQYTKEFAEKLKAQTGITLKLDSYGSYSLDGTDPKKLEKFKLLLRNYMPESAARSVAYEDIVHYYYDGSGQDYNDRELASVRGQIEKYKESKRLQTELKKGVIKTESDVMNALTRLKNNSHPAYHGRLSTLFAKAQDVLPNKKELLEVSEKMATGFKNFTTSKENIGKISFLKKALGPALAVIFSSAAMASDCLAGTKTACNDSIGETAESLFPIPISSLGCSEVYSRFSPVDDKCRADSSFNGNIKSYVMADEDTQKEEFCSTNIKKTIEDVHRRMFPSTLRATCESNKVVLLDDRSKSNSTFIFNGDSIASVTVNTEEDDYYGYQIGFDSNSNPTGGKIYTGRFGRTWQPYQTKPKNTASEEKQAAILDNLSPRVVKAMIARDCCLEKISGSDCSNVSSNTISGSSGKPSKVQK